MRSPVSLVNDFDLMKGCHQRVLKGIMGSEFCFEKFILLPLSGERTQLKAGRRIERLWNSPETDKGSQTRVIVGGPEKNGWT